MVENIRSPSSSNTPIFLQINLTPPLFQQDHQEIISATKEIDIKSNGSVAKEDEHDEDQYLDLIRKILKKGE